MQLLDKLYTGNRHILTGPAGHIASQADTQGSKGFYQLSGPPKNIPASTYTCVITNLCPIISLSLRPSKPLTPTMEVPFVAHKRKDTQFKSINVELSPACLWGC